MRSNMVQVGSKTAKVFVCWSGARSLAVAKRFRALLMDVVPELKDQVFVSTQLEKGVRWFEEIVRTLEGAQAGVLCLTFENLTSPWLHFEAGALAKGLLKSPGPGAAPARSPNPLQQLIDDSRPPKGGEPALDKGRQVRRAIADIRFAWSRISA